MKEISINKILNGKQQAPLRYGQVIKYKEKTLWVTHNATQPKYPVALIALDMPEIWGLYESFDDLRFRIGNAQILGTMKL